MPGRRPALRMNLYVARVSLFHSVFPSILNFIDWMRENLKTRAFGQPNNTYRNRLKDITVFFNHFKITMPLPKKWPKATKKNADKYSMDSINKMLDVAEEDEKDLLSFFLYTGFRDEEAAHAKYSDIDFPQGNKQCAR